MSLSELSAAYLLVALTTASWASRFLFDRSLWTDVLGLGSGSLEAVYFAFFAVSVVRLWSLTFEGGN